MKRSKTGAAVAVLIAVAIGTASAPSSGAIQPGTEAVVAALPVAAAPPVTNVAEAVGRGLARSQPPTDIERALTSQGVAHLKIHRTKPELTERRTSLDPDTFSVRTMWADWYAKGKKVVAFYGFWDFKNRFIGSGAPYDGAAMALSGFGSKCWKNFDTGVVVQDQTGAHQKLGWLKSSGHQRSVFGIHDRTRAFNLLNDMGMGWIEMRRIKNVAGCNGRKSGTFYYEHNQGGNGGWSGSVSLRVFSISYSGNGGLRLQKAAKISYYE